MTPPMPTNAVRTHGRVNPNSHTSSFNKVDVEWSERNPAVVLVVLGWLVDWLIGWLVGSFVRWFVRSLVS